MSLICCFFFKQKTAYEMRISDWSSDVCSSDLRNDAVRIEAQILRCPVPATLAPYIFHLEGNSELCEEPCDLLDIGRCPPAVARQHEVPMPTDPPCRLRLQRPRRRIRNIACRWAAPPRTTHNTGSAREPVEHT